MMSEKYLAIYFNWIERKYGNGFGCVLRMMSVAFRKKTTLRTM